MAEVDVLRTIGAVLLVFFIPGYFLTKALFPRPREFSDELPEVYTAAFSMMLSIAVTILSGIFLGMLPPGPDGRGAFRLENILASLLLLTSLFAAAAWWRGAFPRLGQALPPLERHPSPPPDGTGVADDPKRYWNEQDLLARRRELRAQLRRHERTGRTAGKEKGYYQKRRSDVTSALVKADEDLKKLREEREQAVARAEEEAEKLEQKRRERKDTVLRALRLKRPEGAAETPPKSE